MDKDLSHTKKELELRTTGVDSLWSARMLQNSTLKGLLGWGRVMVEDKRYSFFIRNVGTRFLGSAAGGHSEQLRGEADGEGQLPQHSTVQ